MITKKISLYVVLLVIAIVCAITFIAAAASGTKRADV